MPNQKYIERDSEVGKFAIFVLQELFPGFVLDEIFLTLAKEDEVKVVAKSRFEADKEFVVYLSQDQPISATIFYDGDDRVILNRKTHITEDLSE